MSRPKGTARIDDDRLYKNRLMTLPPKTLREWQKYLNIRTNQIYIRLNNGDFIVCPTIDDE